MTVGSDHYQFGQFRLDPEAGILYRGTEPTMLGQRAVALLRLLLENAGIPVMLEHVELKEGRSRSSGTRSDAV